MQALIELIIGFIAMLAAAALSQFGVDVQSPQSQDREVHRVGNCNSEPASKTLSVSKQHC